MAFLKASPTSFDIHPMGILSMTRVWRIIAVFVVFLVVFTAVPADAAEDDTVSFDGAGWGHGVGMSQYGAEAMAAEGSTHQQILSTYYQGTTLGTIGTNGVPTDGDIFVGVDSDQTTRTVSISNGPGTSATGVVVSRGAAATLQQKELFAGASFTVVDTAPQTNGGCTVAFSDGTAWESGSCDITVPLAPDGALPPYVIALNACRTTNCTFAWGTALLFVDNGSVVGNGGPRTVADTVCPGACPLWPGFDVAVQLPLDTYTRGIAEVPFSWNVETLKAQAIAARSYAATADLRTDHRAAACFCDIKNSSADQVFAGWLGARSLWQTWDAAAVATTGRVIVHPAAPDSTIVRAFYSSSSGGATESSEDKWGGAFPYLISVADPWSLASINPFRSWNETITRASLASWLGLADVETVDVIATNDSGSPSRFRFGGITSGGSSVNVEKSVGEVTSRYGLRSWYFAIAINRPPPLNNSKADQVAMQDPRTGIWHIRHSNGTVDSFYYGNPKDTPYAGDWNGDGIDTMGLYRESNGYLFLRNTNNQGIADIEIYYGIPRDLPVSGDWNGNGVDTVGIYRSSEGRFYLRNTNTQGIADIDFPFGNPGDVPIAGDWDGDGTDTVGVYRPSTRMVYLMNDLNRPIADISFFYSGAASGDRIIAGDWDGDGTDTIGLFRPSTGTWYLRDTFTQTSANIVFEFGEGFMNPTTGFWGE
ncbi:MAG: SpoIID/LytB domain-containing protein [Acidimicrobiia bacterium]